MDKGGYFFFFPFSFSVLLGKVEVTYTGEWDPLFSLFRLLSHAQIFIHFLVATYTRQVLTETGNCTHITELL